MVNKLIIFLIFSLVIPTCCYSTDRRFSWLPNDPNDVTPAVGYKIYCVPRGAGAGTIIVDVGEGEVINGRVYGTVTGLDPSVPDGFYICFATAYSVEGDESDPSNYTYEKVLSNETVTTAIPGRARY